MRCRPSQPVALRKGMFSFAETFFVGLIPAVVAWG